MLDHMVDIKLFLYKKSNKPNILQELEYIPTRKSDQKLSLIFTKELKTKVISIDK